MYYNMHVCIDTYIIRGTQADVHHLLAHVERRAGEGAEDVHDLGRQKNPGSLSSAV